MYRYKNVIKNSSEVLKLIVKEESIESKALTQITIGATYIGLEKYTKALAPFLKGQKYTKKYYFE